MAHNLLGETLISEDTLTLIYRGDSFDKGVVKLRPLYTELKCLEELLRDSVDLLIRNGKLDGSADDFEIYIEIEKGSLKQKIKVLFAHPATTPIISAIVGPLLVATYTHFLSTSPTPTGEFHQEIQEIGNDQQFKNNLRGVLSPMDNDNDILLINNGEMNFNLDATQREQIEVNLDQEQTVSDPASRNGDQEETLTGIIRKIDLDAPGQNYLGFNIDRGASRVPTSIEGPFNLLDYKELINARVKIRAVVRYKDDVIKHITIKNAEILEKQAQIDL